MSRCRAPLPPGVLPTSTISASVRARRMSRWSTSLSWTTTSADSSSSSPLTVMSPGSPGPAPTRYTTPAIAVTSPGSPLRLPSAERRASRQAWQVSRSATTPRGGTSVSHREPRPCRGPGARHCLRNWRMRPRGPCSSRRCGERTPARPPGRRWWDSGRWPVSSPAAAVAAPRLDGQRPLARVRDEGLGREEIVGLVDAPSLARPAAATTTPSHSGPPTLPRRVPTLPRMGTTSMSGRRDFSSAVRLGLPVPILAPGGSSDSGVAHLSMSASLGSCRGTLPAMTRPSGSSLARSFALWTARSMSPFSSAISISLANAPLPRLTRAASFLRSPPVVMGVTSKTAEGKPSLRRETTSSACARARGLPRVPIRYLADMAGQPGRSTHRRGLPRRGESPSPQSSPVEGEEAGGPAGSGALLRGDSPSPQSSPVEGEEAGGPAGSGALLRGVSPSPQSSPVEGEEAGGPARSGAPS